MFISRLADVFNWCLGFVPLSWTPLDKMSANNDSSNRVNDTGCSDPTTLTWRCIVFIVANGPHVPRDSRDRKLRLNHSDPMFRDCTNFQNLFRAMQAWLPTLLTPVLLLSIILSVFPKFFIETFVIPMNGMAPTVLGNHWQGACVECGNPAFCSPTRRPVTSSDRPVMICRDNFHVTQPTNYDKQVIPPDRFLIAKFLRPQRWDIVVFRYPADPSLLYVKRLIGLPGEEIIIRDGQVWANGQMLAKPNSIHGIDYVSEIPKWHGELSGTPNRPAKLADNEYFVLGDFSPQSKDSRLWTQGAPGQNPFAVPQSHLYGVVTQIYWPPSRWRRFR